MPPEMVRLLPEMALLAKDARKLLPVFKARYKDVPIPATLPNYRTVEEAIQMTIENADASTLYAQLALEPGDDKTHRAWLLLADSERNLARQFRRERGIQ